MPSDIVQIGSSSGRGAQSFVQNGQVDWVAFANSIWSTSSAVLQRFASAGVQPITLGAGLALASQLHLGHVGKQRLHSAIENVRGVWSFEKLLYFGFGARSFLSVMSDTQLGVTCVALCSSLAEVHSEHASAWILDELWKLYGFPREYLPSHSQLTALIKACSGVLAKTEFSVIPDRMLGHTLNPHEVVPMISDIEDIAKAIRGLFEISKGNISRITVTGGKECAFIAGFAQWLLNLKVYVEDEAGRVIYQDSTPEEAQVVATYRRPAELSLVQVSSTTYILREVDDILIRNPGLDHILLIIRTPWDGCLTRVFGTAFSALTKSPTILGGFFGSVARVYRGLAMGESDVGKFSRKTYINYVESSYGEGFINSIISIFPELKDFSGLFDEMQLALNVPLKEALRTTERTVLDLGQLCKCSTCTPSGTTSEASCILAISLSIREMVSTISCTIRDNEILPTVRGIQCVYNRAASKFAMSKTARQLPLLSIALDLPMEGMQGDFVDHHRNFDLLSHPMEIFSGHSYHSRYLPENNPQGKEFCTATVRQGLCYYLNGLRSLSSQAENARMVHILPGHIQMGDRQFNSTYDPPVQHRSVNLSSIQFDIIEEFNPTNTFEQPRLTNIKLEAFGLEKATDHELTVFYKAVMPGEPALTLWPGQISHEVLKGTGILTCEQMHCNSRLVIPCVLIRGGWHVPDTRNSEAGIDSRTGHMCLIWPQLDDLARCVAVQERLHEAREMVFFRRQECVSCCTSSLAREQPQESRKKLFHIL